MQVRTRVFNVNSGREVSVLFNLSSRYPSVRRSRILFKAIGQGFSTLYTCDYWCDF